ncbi:hypothetical protein ACFQX6_35150 [Streptosporangium lutulentum]
MPDAPADKFGYAAARTTDPLTLTLNEVFRNKKIKIGGQSYLMTTRRADKKCGDAVVGSKLQKALTGGKCNQLLRASFRDASGKIIGTVGVANLSTSKGPPRSSPPEPARSERNTSSRCPAKTRSPNFSARVRRSWASGGTGTTS